jgi:hypothetical protein
MNNLQIKYIVRMQFYPVRASKLGDFSAATKLAAAIPSQTHIPTECTFNLLPSNFQECVIQSQHNPEISRRLVIRVEVKLSKEREFLAVNVTITRT